MTAICNERETFVAELLIADSDKKGEIKLKLIEGVQENSCLALALERECGVIGPEKKYLFKFTNFLSRENYSRCTRLPDTIQSD